jgi:GNAT superfamily N-acetyltransferase
MPNARLAQTSDLASLLELYQFSEVSPSVESKERAQQIWAKMLSHEGVAVFVSCVDAKIVATCMLITAPNLLRAGRQHGFLENVVTHPEFRRQGHGRAVVSAALAAAWTKGCYHVLLQSGRADPRVHRFYELRLRARASDRLRCAPSKLLIPHMARTGDAGTVIKQHRTVVPITPPSQGRVGLAHKSRLLFRQAPGGWVLPWDAGLVSG